MESERIVVVDPSSAEARAQRLLWVRRMVNLPRQIFSDYPGLNPDCIYRWEKVKRGGLTRKGAQRVVERLAQLNVVCSTQWLLEGLGAEPFAQQHSAPITVAPLMGNAEEAQIAKELAVFRYNDHAVEWLVPDNLMAPEYQVGDYVAGVEIADFTQAIGLVCIVTTTTGERLLRLVQPGSEVVRYALLCTNPQQQLTIQHNVELHSVAPILWRRRPWSKIKVESRVD